MRYGLALLAIIATLAACGEKPSHKTVRSEHTWVLEGGGATLYAQEEARPLIHVALPGWHWVGEPFSCGPAIAAGPAGEAVVTSDAATTLWRIDPAGLAVSVHEPVLDADGDKDAGFVGLVYARPLSAYFAVTGHGGLWRIDPLLRRAQKIALNAPLHGACGIRLQDGERRLGAFVVSTTDGPAMVQLAPDQRSAFVRTGPSMSGSGNDASGRHAM